MQIAVRSSVATGVALVGAGAIALSPVQPVASPLSSGQLPAVFSTTGVQLSASFDPVTPWVDVLTAAVSNVTAIGEDWLGNPLPAARQLGINLAGYADTTATALGDAAKGAVTYFTTTAPEALTTAFQQIADGNLSGAATTINDALGAAILTIGLPLFPVLSIPGEMADHFTAVVKAVTGLDTLVGLLLGALGPLEGGIQSFGDTAQDILDAAQAGDAVATLNAAFAVVPNVLGAVINGYDPEGSNFPGLLTPALGGLVYSLAISIPQALATALGAAPPVTVLKQAARSAEAVAAQESDGTESASGTAQSKRAAAADDSAVTAESAGGEAAASAEPAVKDGNKVEPGQVSASSAAGARKAAASAKPAESKVGKATGATGKGRSARPGRGDS